MVTFKVIPLRSFPSKIQKNGQNGSEDLRDLDKPQALIDNAEENQVSALVYTMGDEAEDILGTLNLSAAQSKKYADVSAAFQRYFIARRNTIFERPKFNQRKQESGKPIDSLITSLGH